MPAPADYEQQVRAGDLDVALEVDADFAKDVAKGRPGKVRLVYDRSRDRARASISEVESLLRAYASEWARGRLLLRGISPDVVNPLRIESRDLATPQSSGSVVLGLDRLLRPVRRADGRDGRGARRDRRRARARVAGAAAHHAGVAARARHRQVARRSRC